MRRMICFSCQGSSLAATLDKGDKATGLLIVSGGNEIRSGAHAGQSAMAAHFASLGFPVFRYDRRGVGESEGDNAGFERSADDIAAAVAAFRKEAPHISRLVAFGNCDAASALALFHAGLALDHLILANPWVIEAKDEDTPSQPSAAAIRARYWARLKNPRSLIDLVTGKVNLGKLVGGLAKASISQAPSALAGEMAAALSRSAVPITFLAAQRDNTAMAFNAVWKTPIFADVQKRSNVEYRSIASASHSFADAETRLWLWHQISAVLMMPKPCRD
jgi:exosortase A-associated hydrolase 1